MQERIAKLKEGEAQEKSRFDCFNILVSGAESISVFVREVGPGSVFQVEVSALTPAAPLSFLQPLPSLAAV